MIGRIIEGTIVLVMAYLILSNASGFSSAIRAIGSVYSNSVRTLQGR